MTNDQTARFYGGKVNVHDDNLTDIAENLFWFREQHDQDRLDRKQQADAIIERLDILIQLLQTPQKTSVSPDDIKHILDGFQPSVSNVSTVIHADTSAKSRAIQWLIANDPDLKLTAREAATKSGLAQATLNRAKQELEAQRQKGRPI